MEEKKVKPVIEEKSMAVKTDGLSIESLFSRAIDNQVSVDTLERLMAMRRELKAEFAKAEYDRSMAEFQCECPEIKKTKQVKTRAGILAYKYAPIEAIVAQVKDLLTKHGFSYSTQIQTSEGYVKAVCVVKHSAGHTESYEMQVPLGNKTDVMSNSQVYAAAATFAKRYAFCNAFGIMTGDDDNEEKLKSGEKSKPSAKEFYIEEKKLRSCLNIVSLQAVWNDISAEAKQSEVLIAVKDEMKVKLSKVK
jgi:hypothetical protein